MCLPTFRLIRGMVAAGAVVAAWGVAPTVVAAEPASVASGASTYLRMNVACNGMRCEAWASGGSGTYVGVEWSLAEELWDDGGVSWADAEPYCVPGMMLGVGATVTDSNGGQASGSAWVFC